MDNIIGSAGNPAAGTAGSGVGLGLLGGLFGMSGLSPSETMVGAGLTLLVMTWLLNSLRSMLITSGEWIRSRFYYTARISYPDQAFIWMLEWLSVQDVFGTRAVTVYTRYHENSDIKSGKPEFKLLPTGTVWIRFKGYLVYIVRESSEKRSIDGMREDFIDVTILRGNRDIVNDLISTAMDYSINLNKDKTKIFSLDPHSQFWECISIQPKRTIESVILDSNIGQKVIEDVDNFVNGKQWYVNTGVPYRRGYLLYGPPGTGKTSFILSVAGKFGMSISIMNMSKGIHDGNIHSIIQKTPKETILVLEDIDAAFVQRGGKNDVLTFSGLLNALDGLASSDGRILIMTTNHIERLAPSLVRPGRIDIKIKFDYATDFQITQMLKRFFTQDNTLTKPVVDKIIDRLRNHKISTAQLQGWFIIHRDDPSQLLLTIEDFLAQCERESSSSSSKSNNKSPLLNGNGNGIAPLKSLSLHGSPDEVHLLSNKDNNEQSSDSETETTNSLRFRSYVPTMVD